MELREEKHRVESTLGQKIDNFDPETMEDEKIVEKDETTVTTAKTLDVLSAVHHNMPKVAHAQSHDISHSEPVRNLFNVCKKKEKKKKNPLFVIVCTLIVIPVLFFAT